MDRSRAAKPPAWQSSGWRADDDSDLGNEELSVFTAERYFNDDALAGEDALWCDRSSLSFSSAFKTCQHDESVLTRTAATSSSEASWNSRSALLSNRPASAAAPVIEGKSNSPRESEPARGKARPPSSHLRRWILGVAWCACGSSDIEESMSADDFYHEEKYAGSIDGGKTHSSEADATLTGGTSNQTAVEEGATARMMSGKPVEDGGAPPALLLAEPARHRAANPGVLSSIRMPDPAANAPYDERRRRSLDIFHQAGQGRPHVSVSATQSSAYTIVAGSTARGGAFGGGSRSPSRPHRRLDSDVPSEVEYMYPPSEASIVWSVVTAEGAASGNFSSPASGCYYYFNDGEEEAMQRHTAAVGKSNRRGRHNGGRGGGLLTGCMSKRAVNTVGRPRTWSEVEPAPVARVRGPDMARRR